MWSTSPLLFLFQVRIKQRVWKSEEHRPCLADRLAQPGSSQSMVGAPACQITVKKQTFPAALFRHTLLFICFTVLCRHSIFFSFFFLQSESLSQLYVELSVDSTFPIAFAWFVYLCHVLVIVAIFQTFSLLLYLLCNL